jgi:hypothetical protein
MIKNSWILPIIKQAEDEKRYGKLSLNMVNGEIVGIKKEEDIKKPKDSDRELE